MVERELELAKASKIQPASRIRPITRRESRFLLLRDQESSLLIFLPKNLLTLANRDINCFGYWTRSAITYISKRKRKREE